MSARGADGKFARSLETAERDAEACRLRSRGLSYAQIAAELGISRTQAYEGVQRALREIVSEPAEELRHLELLRLDEMYRAALAVLEGRHYVVDKGGVVMMDGVPVEDDGPRLAAIDRLLKIQERRAKLLGLDTPVKQEVDLNGGIRYEVVGVDLDQVT